MMGKYLANLNLNKTTCTYITILYVGLEAPKSLELEAISLKMYSTKLLRVYNRVCSSSRVVCMFKCTVNDATTSNY